MFMKEIEIARLYTQDEIRRWFRSVTKEIQNKKRAGVNLKIEQLPFFKGRMNTIQEAIIDFFKNNSDAVACQIKFNTKPPKRKTSGGSIYNPLLIEIHPVTRKERIEEIKVMIAQYITARIAISEDKESANKPIPEICEGRRIDKTIAAICKKILVTIL